MRLDAVQRAVTGGRIAAGEGRTIRMERTFDAPIEDAWDALTDPEQDQPLVPADQRRVARSAGDISWRAMPAARSSPASRRIGSG